MPKVRLTLQMRQFAKAEIAAGLYLDTSDVVRAAMRRLMEERGAAAFYRLKLELEATVREFELTGGLPFDPREFEPNAFR